MTDKHDIPQMLYRFMIGSTTEQEKRLLADYFQTSTDVPGEWTAYANPLPWISSADMNRFPA